MINVRTLKNLKENDGLTLKKGKRITYKTGWQVATEGIETTDPYVAMKAIKAYGGGLWYLVFKRYLLYRQEPQRKYKSQGNGNW